MLKIIIKLFFRINAANIDKNQWSDTKKKYPINKLKSSFFMVLLLIKYCLYIKQSAMASMIKGK